MDGSSDPPNILLVVDLLDFVPEGPPGALDFRGWLAERTPMDAPTLLINAPGGRGPLRLPQIRPAALAPPRRAGRRRRGAAAAVQAACLVDVDGLRFRELACLPAFGFSSERSARQHVRDGRFVAAELGLWPWAVVGGQALHHAWWSDERFALALQSWARTLRPPEVEPLVRRLRAPRRHPAARLPVA